MNDLIMEFMRKSTVQCPVYPLVLAQTVIHPLMLVGLEGVGLVRVAQGLVRPKNVQIIIGTFKKYKITI